MLEVSRETVSDHLTCRVPVSHDHSVPSPLIAEDVLEKPFITCRRYSVDLVEGCHESRSTCFCSRLECREISVAEHTLCNHCGIIVTSAFSRTIAYEMLDAGSECCRVAEVITLITTYHCKSHLHIKIWILTRALSHAAPTRITGNVKHRRECPSHTACGSLDRCHASASLYDIRIECRCKSERNREHGVESVDDVTSHQHRDSKAALLHCCLLHGINLGRVDTVEDRAHFTLCRLVSHPCTARKLVHLADLLAKGHLLEKVIDLLVCFALRSA